MSALMFHNDTCEINHLWYNSHKNLLTAVCIELGEIGRIAELSEKLLGQQLKMKPLKDPSKPKRPMTSYLYFCEVERPRVLAKYKSANRKIIIGEVAKELGVAWRKLSGDQLTHYKEKSEADRQRYQEQMAAWKLQ